MSQKIDPRQVLEYLNELGYTNISSQQLKEFIIDLKKIMKYEERKKKVLGPNFELISDNNYSTPLLSDLNVKHKQSNTNDIFEALHNQTTEAFKAKMVHRQVHQIAVHIIQPKKKNIEHEHCVHPQNNQASYKNQTNSKSTQDTALKENIFPTESSNYLETDTSTVKNLRPTSKQSCVSSSVPSSKFKKSKTAVLRNNSSNKLLKKSDPVALYHQYQQEWKHIKFPGEDNHLDLRWAVREKLINGPPVEKKH